MSIYNTREWTAKTVNEELHSLLASCERIAKRLASKPGCPKLTDLLARQQATLDKAIAAALEGRMYRHRGEVAGERLEQFSARKAKIRARRIVAQFPTKAEK